MNTTPFALATVALLWAQALVVHAVTAVPAVGQVTLVIGQAHIVGPEGQHTPVQTGSAVRVGDRVETQAGGHVYLRFVDGASLSIRPQSRMQIESYSHNPQQPQLGAIKFKLDEGTARSITGAWGEAARERFRLNTPVAAIGVRGTDFTVRSDTERTTATVYTGAIVLAPLHNGCAQTVGPCQSNVATLLSGDMRGQMLELSSRENAPLLVAASTLNAPPPRQARAADTAIATAARTSDLSDSRHDNTPIAKALDTETRGVAVAVREINIPTPTVPPASPVQPPEVPIQLQPPQVQQLAWARYDWTPHFQAEEFVKTFADAVATGLQRINSNGAYALLQAPNTNGVSGASLPAEAKVDFRLAQAAAHLLPPVAWEKAQPVNVLSGNLQVDFSRALFQTALTMQGQSIGYQSVYATGNVLPTGALQATAGDAALMGTLTADRQEAAYAFEKPLPSGALRGVTLWGR